VNDQYALVAPWAAYSTYSFAAAKVRGEEGDLLSFFVLPTVLLRLLYTQLWISISRHQTARSKHRIVSKSLDFDQVDRERNWYCTVHVGLLGHFNKHMQNS
jgi:aldehyde decarbonylase